MVQQVNKAVNGRGVNGLSSLLVVASAFYTWDSLVELNTATSSWLFLNVSGDGADGSSLKSP